MSIKIVPMSSNAIEFFSATEFFNVMFEDRGASKIFTDWTEVHSLAAVAICNVLATQMASYDEELSVKISAQLRTIAMNYQRDPANYRIGRCTYSSIKDKPYQHQFVATLVIDNKVDVYIFQINSPLFKILEERKNTKELINSETQELTAK